MRIKPYTTLADRLLIMTLLILAALLSFLMPRWVISGGKEVELRAGDTLVGRYSLDESKVLEVHGPLGTTTVQIKQGTARVLSSPCPNKCCIRMGDVGREGGVIVCVPNKVIVTVGPGQVDGLDAVSR